MSPEVIHIDELARYCGFFTSKTDANNGYGCNHPDQEEAEDDLWRDEYGHTHRGFGKDNSKPKVKQGKCYSFSCPLARICTVEDLEEFDPDFFATYETDKYGDIVDDYVVCEDEKLLKKINS